VAAASVTVSVTLEWHNTSQYGGRVYRYTSLAASVLNNNNMRDTAILREYKINSQEIHTGKEKFYT